MTFRRHTDFAAFVLDLMDFIEERIREALDSEPSRAVAIVEAGGAAPVLRDRLHEDEAVLGQLLLLLGEQLDESRGPDWWRTFAITDRAEFEREAENLLKPGGTLAALRRAVEASAQT